MNWTKVSAAIAGAAALISTAVEQVPIPDAWDPVLLSIGPALVTNAALLRDDDNDGTPNIIDATPNGAE